MSTYSQVLYHIVFCTKHRDKCLVQPQRDELFKHISGTLRNKKCYLYTIGGIEDHLHILTHIPPSLSISSIVKDIKLSSSDFIKSKGLLSNFRGWQEGYAVFTVSFNNKTGLINYILNQEEHHKIRTFKEEYVGLLEENSILYEEKFLF